jgi:glycosyltransferase involved in cell wall biosynthesis
MNIFYFPLESVKSRYTGQLCQHWIPDAFRAAIQLYPERQVSFCTLIPNVETPADIQVGAVLDACGRSRFGLAQCDMMVQAIAKGEVQNGDAVYLQDFYTPGFDSVLYTASLYNIRLRVFAMCHAQSVDPHDFTNAFAYWMRSYEKMLSEYMKQNQGAIFVASSIHSSMLLNAGINPPIHVISLPFDYKQVNHDNPAAVARACQPKLKQVVFSSRLDAEKNPLFMFEVAHNFLAKNPDWSWAITTSSSKFRSGDSRVLDMIEGMRSSCPGFKFKENLTKAQYYETLAESAIQFNSSSQDFVSWTLLEAMNFGCVPVYPNYCSFPECVKQANLYEPLGVDSAVRLLTKAANGEIDYRADDRRNLLQRSNMGRLMIPHFILSPQCGSFNIWTTSNTLFDVTSRFLGA